MRSNFEEKNYKRIWRERGLLFLISIIIVLIIKPPIKHYTIKDYDKFAKKYGIEYEVINCPRCRAKIPDTIQFCYRCNEILFDADDETIEILNKINENVEKLAKSDPIGNMIDKINVVLFYLTMIVGVYGLLILFETILKFIQSICTNFKNRIR